MSKRMHVCQILPLLLVIPACSQPTDSLRAQMEAAEKRAKQSRGVTSHAQSSQPKESKDPVGRISLLGDPSDKPIRLKAGQVTLEYIAHACFRIHTPGGKRILIDPYDGNGWLYYHFPKEVAADGVLITHGHWDHDAGTSQGRKAPWTEDVRVLRFPGKFTIGDAQLTGINGIHSTNHGNPAMPNTLWLIEVSGMRILHFGDNGPLSQENVEQVGAVDILLLPLDAEGQILDEHQAAKIRQSLRPRVVIPMHYRIPELESRPTAPSGLGPIDPCLVNEKNVKRLDGHRETFAVDTLPETEQILVFKHSPKVTMFSP